MQNKKGNAFVRETAVLWLGWIVVLRKQNGATSSQNRIYIFL